MLTLEKGNGGSTKQNWREQSGGGLGSTWNTKTQIQQVSQ